MSNREKCIALIEQIDERYLAHVAAILQIMKDSLDQAAADAIKPPVREK